MWARLSEVIEQHPTNKVDFLVDRAGKKFAVSLTPEMPISPPNQKPRVGILWDANGKTTLAHPGPLEQVDASVTAMFETFGALLSPPYRYQTAAPGRGGEDHGRLLPPVQQRAGLARWRSGSAS